MSAIVGQKNGQRRRQWTWEAGQALRREQSAESFWSIANIWKDASVPESNLRKFRWKKQSVDIIIMYGSTQIFLIFQIEAKNKKYKIYNNINKQNPQNA